MAHSAQASIPTVEAPSEHVAERRDLFMFFWRAWQITACCAILLALSPVLLTVALLIKLESRGPVFYRQTRVGQDGRKFRLFKFRSLRVGTEQSVGGGFMANTEDYATRIGTFIRKTKIDEIPQMFNVILGHMNFVGPRPIREVFYTELVTGISDYHQRFHVKPGMTGLAQLLTPYKTPNSQRLKYDLWYIDNRSTWLDTRIVLLTLIFCATQLLRLEIFRRLYARLAYGPDGDASRAFIPLPASLYDRRAHTALETWATNNPQVPEFHFQLALFLSEQGYLDESIQKFKDALALDSNHTKARIKLGYALALDGQCERAIEVFESLVQDSVTYPDIFCTLGILYDLTGDQRRGLANLRRALQINPRYRDAQISTASLLERQQSRDDGRVSHAPPDRPSLSSILFRKSCMELKYESEGTTNLAELHEAVRKNPEYADLHYRLGNRLADAGNWSEAISAFGRALALNPRYTFAHVAVGQTYACLDEYGRAIAAYDQAIASSPSNPDLHYDQGVFHYHLGHLERALDKFEHAYRLHPEIFQENSAFLAKTLAHRSAEEIEQWMFDSGDSQGLSLKARGDRLFIQGKYVLAQAAYQQVLASDRTNTEVWRSLGIIYRKRGFYALALQNFQVALDLAPHDRAPLGDLGLTCHLLGTPDARRAMAAQRRVA
jgi:lipopolysaccharide/colanic/teichoic acid biosynthesis glycosyltransferase/Flp pilus assembly protein TadD